MPWLWASAGAFTSAERTGFVANLYRLLLATAVGIACTRINKTRSVASLSRFLLATTSVAYVASLEVFLAGTLRDDLVGSRF